MVIKGCWPYCWQADSSTQPETSHRSPNGDQKYIRRDWKKVKTKDGTASQKLVHCIEMR